MSDKASRIAGLSPDKLKMLLQQVNRKKEADTAKAMIRPHDRSSNYSPLSFAQQRVWFLTQFEPDNPSYNLSVALRIPGSVDVGALERSFTEILRRHEILRTTYTVSDGQPAQVISPPQPFKLPVIDTCQIPAAERQAEVLRIATEEAVLSFDITSGPVLRAVLLKLDEKEYALLLAVHHIAFDYWSIGLLIHEMTSLYDAYASGQPSPLAELPIQYVDYAVWQRQYLQGDLLKSQLDYWKKKLSGVPVLELPADRPRPKVQTFRGAHQNLSIGRELTAGLKSLAEKEGATLFMTLLAVFDVLLLRYTGQEDISVGTPTAGRNRVETEGLIGFFVNTLVMRVDAGGNPSFREMLRRVKEVAREAYAKQDVPFEKIVEEVQPERDLSHTPLFQTTFQLKKPRFEQPAEGRLKLETIEVEKGRAQFDLSMELWDLDKEITGRVEYNTDLFYPERIGRMIEHFHALVESIVADPDERILDLQLLTQAERQQLLIEWNTMESDYPRGKSLVELFEAQVREKPEAVALVSRGEWLTYFELNRRANRLARRLMRSGIGRESLVGISIARSLDMIVSILAVLKTGAAFVCLDARYPQHRLEFMLQDAGISLLIDRRSAGEKTAPRGDTVARLDLDWNEIAGEEEGDPGIESDPDNLAYVVYTSGSTGTPKGVMALHRGAVNRVFWQKYPFAEGEVCCQKTSVNFVDSVYEIFGPLLHGVRLVIITDEELADLQQFLSALAENGVTRIVLVPSLLRSMLDNISDLEARLPQLKHWVSSGEELSGELAFRFHRSMPGRSLVNLYGSSEASADATFFEADDDGFKQSVPIGRPIANTQAHVLDSRLHPAPVGVVGEVYVGGEGLARGYINHPDLTAEKFIPNPYAHEPGERFYRSGDLARRLPGGSLEFAGRADQQVNIRGYRVEPGEIEMLLAQHPAVERAIVSVREIIPGDKRLIAYLVCKPDREPTVREIRGFLKRKLPDYMLPSVFASLDSLPLTPNGKVDRSALPGPTGLRTLPAPTNYRSNDEAEFVPPRTPVEESVARIWMEVLGVTQVGIHDNFFELGGYSLLITQITARLFDAFQVQLPQRTIFEAPTVADLASVIERKLKESDGSERFDEILRGIESLSPEEVELAISEESGKEASEGVDEAAR